VEYGSETKNAQSANQEKLRYRPAKNFVATGSRNCRTVWTVATRAFPGAHFATFPPQLIQVPIKARTSEAGVCPACGAQYRRHKTEIGRQVTEQMRRSGSRADGTYGGEAQKDYAKARAPDPSATKRRILAAQSKVWRHEFRPSCACNAGEPARPRVLDPFMGAGTVGLVAEENNCDWLGIELNPDYARMGMERIISAREKRMAKKPDCAKSAEVV